MLIAVTLTIIPAGGAGQARRPGDKAQQPDELRRLNLANGVK
jgi:hypothetical protein